MTALQSKQYLEKLAGELGLASASVDDLLKQYETAEKAARHLEHELLMKRVKGKGYSGIY